MSLFFLSSWLLFHERTTNYSITKLLSSIHSLVLVSCLVFSFKSLFLIFVCFPDFYVVFLVQHNACKFQKRQVKNTCLVKRGVATKRFFFSYVKSYRFLTLFWQNLVDVQKHYNVGISVHFSSKKQK